MTTMPKMTDMGMTRGEMDGGSASPATPKSEKDWKKEMVYPRLDVRGEQAKMLGAEDLEQGEYLQQTVIWKVKTVVKTEENGKKDFQLCLEMVKGSDLTPAKDPGGAEDSADASEESPGLAYVLAGAKGE